MLGTYSCVVNGTCTKEKGITFGLTLVLRKYERGYEFIMSQEKKTTSGMILKYFPKIKKN